MFLFFFCLSSFQIPVDGIPITKISHSVSHHNHTLLISPIGPGMADVFLIDHESWTAQMIEDGRIAVNSHTRIIPSSSGFVLVTSQKESIYWLDTTGRFLKQNRFDELKGLPVGFEIKSVFFVKEGVGLLTLKSPEEIGLAELDIESLTIREKFRMKEDFAKSSCFAYSNSTYFYVDQYIGQVDVLSTSFKRSMILAGRTPILAVKNKKMADYMASNGLSPYERLLSGVIQINGQSSLLSQDRVEGRVTVIGSYPLRPDKLTVEQNVMLAQYQGKTLYFDIQDDSLRLEDESKPRP